MKKLRAVDIIAKVVKNIQGAKPSREKMIEDLRVMQVKIRSHAGDISVLGTIQTSFIESVWTIGKIEEIVDTYMDRLDLTEQDKLMGLLDDIEMQTQNLSQQSHMMAVPADASNSQDLTVEVYKEYDDNERTIVN